MDVPDQGGLLRVRDGGQPPVTPLELFFDLVFVFAVTQLSNRSGGLSTEPDWGPQ